MATDAKVGEHPDYLSARFPVDGSGGAGEKARSIFAVHARKRDVAESCIRITACLHLEHLAPRRRLLTDLEVVLIHAGHGAGEAAAAALDIQIESVAHREASLVPTAAPIPGPLTTSLAGPVSARLAGPLLASSPTLLTEQSSALKPGKPDSGSR